MGIELERLISENIELEDTFVIDAELRIESYKESMRKLCMEMGSYKRITVYPEDKPLYQVAVNTNFNLKS